MRPRITLVSKTIREIREREQKFNALIKYELRDNPDLTWGQAKKIIKTRFEWIR